MKKTLLAAALAAGFAGAAHAQTSVTLYGVLDTGLGYTRFKDGRAPAGTSSKATKFGLYDGVSAGNRWGLRGTEDLGGGLKAVFNLESGFKLTRGTQLQGTTPNDTDRLFGREAFLGLTSDAWGSLKFGRQTNFASHYAGGVVLPQNDAFAQAHRGATFTSTSTVRADNMITYETPVFSGFQFGVGYSFNVNAAQFYDQSGQPERNDRLLSLGLRYTNGPLAMMAAYDQLDTRDGVAADIKSWLIGASYDFDVVKLHLGFGQDKDGTFAGRNPTTEAGGGSILTRAGLATQGTFGYRADYKTNNYGIGLGIPLSTGKVTVSWQSARLSSGAYKLAREENSQDLYAVTYVYPLSKRTSLYALGVYGDGYAFNDVKVTQAVFGLRHDF